MKVLLIDADGVLLKSEELFSNRLAAEYNISLESVSDFFRGPFSQCQSGTKDMREELPAYLEKWGWQSGLDEFLNYWFQSDTIFDETVVDAVRKIKESGIRCYLASNNEKYRAADLRRRIEQKELLDGYFFSWELQAKKDKTSFFESLLNKLNISPEEIYFVDDDQRNVDVAAGLGIEAYVYQDDVFNQILAKI